MILADKLIRLRRQAGWSQEELAEQLGVTRQSVSKWEGAQSVPDLDKVVQMSRLFGVTTDYLLKDELETPQSSAAEADTPLPRLTEAEAARYLDLRRTAAPRMALGTLLCVLSPVCLILLAGMSDLWPNRVPANLATGIGMCVLLGMVAAAVALFLSCRTAERDFAFLDGSFVMDRGAAAMVQEARQRFAPTQARLNTVATLLCILGDSLLSIGAMCLLRFWPGAAASSSSTPGPCGPASTACCRRGTMPPTARAAGLSTARSAWSTGWWSPPSFSSTPSVPTATASPSPAGSSGPWAAYCTARWSACSVCWSSGNKEALPMKKRLIALSMTSTSGGLHIAETAE